MTAPPSSLFGVTKAYAISMAVLPLSAVLAYLPDVYGNVVYLTEWVNYDSLQPRNNMLLLESSNAPAPVKQAYGRCKACHQNNLETFPFFASGLLASLFLGVDSRTTDTLSAGWLVSRLVYTLSYVKGTSTTAATVRNLSWTASMGCAATLMLLALRSALAVVDRPSRY
ncbi:Membrane-associated protein in eicosanoid and glutathione metabolism (MAPEG) [Balamuthia mandrillaris]